MLSSKGSTRSIPGRDRQIYGIWRNNVKKPNILFIFADQLRYSALACSGNRIVQTPNLDRLGREGVVFDRAFSSCPICSPYRAQVLTGKYSHVNGVMCNEYRLFDGQKTLPQLLKAQGYRSAYVGKWHLGNGPYTEHRRYGFDDMYAHNCNHNYYAGSYWHNGEGPFPMVEYAPNAETELALEYLKRHEEPTCVMLSWGPPHWGGGRRGRRYGNYPEQHNLYDPGQIALSENVPIQFRDFARRDIADYYGMVSSLDACMGRILDELERTGLAENTIVCFSSDHGDHLNSHGFGTPADGWMHHSLQGSKATPYDESCHIPFLMRFPDRIPPNSRTCRFLNSVDVLPTLLELCEAPIPPDIQGRSLAGAALGTGEGGGEDSVYLQILGTGWPTRAKWLGLWRGVRTEAYMYARWHDGRRLLIDLKKDRAEMHNLADDLDCVETTVRMEELLADWIEKTKDPFDTGKRLPVTGMLDLGQAFTTTRWHSSAPPEYVEAIVNNHLRFRTGELPTDSPAEAAH